MTCPCLRVSAKTFRPTLYCISHVILHICVGVCFSKVCLYTESAVPTLQLHSHSRGALRQLTHALTTNNGVSKDPLWSTGLPKTFNRFGLASTAVLRQFENAPREKTEPIIVPHWSNGQSGTLKKFAFASQYFVVGPLRFNTSNIRPFMEGISFSAEG